ncbi:MULTISPECIES: transglutaminase family protein [Paracoccaceae]|jgi:transglutaminase-like putative cysteine protease|uniref:transglutaminase family protein n=1 Tax=Rhodobacterales TaxID=204455 RepID=UPI001B27829A|nr:transglutaminase family protein [Boseongicola sp. H5]MBO6604170.1 transglutaminase family protein [Roseicyclus sp.]MBO6626169.1 transglutaminase family protein [Roseicyclus sp.]MBO6923631.1 transglutaminase family protein [Roseicyclus sp.]
MRLKVLHTTTYHFDKPVSYGLQQLRVVPKSSAGQQVLNWQMEIEGGSAQTSFTDHHQNQVSLISFDPQATSIVVHCAGEVETNDEAGVIGKHGGFAPVWLFQRPTDLTRAGPNVRRLARGLKDEIEDDIPRLHALSTRIIEAVAYRTGTTGAETTAEDAIEIGSGVCQDHAHIFIAAARAMGYPARYVSGYLMMDDRVHQDASHAWAEVHIPPLGWVGFDISNGISPDPRYVRVATGLDYTEAAPISGLRFGNAGEAMMVDIQVQQQ